MIVDAAPPVKARLRLTGAIGNWPGRLKTTKRPALTDWLITAMQSLPPEIRDTLALILDDVTHQEAGQILGVSQGTISWRVSQAKSQLRALKAQEQTL